MDRASAQALAATRCRQVAATGRPSLDGAGGTEWLLPDRKLRLQPQPDEHGLDLADEREWLRRMQSELASLKAELKFRQFFHSFKAGFRHDQPRVLPEIPRAGAGPAARALRSLGPVLALALHGVDPILYLDRLSMIQRCVCVLR